MKRLAKYILSFALGISLLVTPLTTSAATEQSLPAAGSNLEIVVVDYADEFTLPEIDVNAKFENMTINEGANGTKEMGQAGFSNTRAASEALSTLNSATPVLNSFTVDAYNPNTMVGSNFSTDTLICFTWNYTHPEGKKIVDAYYGGFDIYGTLVDANQNLIGLVTKFSTAGTYNCGMIIVDEDGNMSNDVWKNVTVVKNVATKLTLAVDAAGCDYGAGYLPRVGPAYKPTYTVHGYATNAKGGGVSNEAVIFDIQVDIGEEGWMSLWDSNYPKGITDSNGYVNTSITHQNSWYSGFYGYSTGVSWHSFYLARVKAYSQALESGYSYYYWLVHVSPY